MAGGRGIVEAEVAGSTRRLRLSLEAIDEIETRLAPVRFPAVLETLVDQELFRFGFLLEVFVAMCKAGGTPLTDEERADLLPSDFPAILEAVIEGLVAVGAIERPTSTDASPAPVTKKKAPRSRSRRPGGTGTK